MNPEGPGGPPGDIVIQIIIADNYTGIIENHGGLGIIGGKLDEYKFSTIMSRFIKTPEPTSIPTSSEPSSSVPSSSIPSSSVPTSSEPSSIPTSSEPSSNMNSN